MTDKERKQLDDIFAKLNIEDVPANSVSSTGRWIDMKEVYDHMRKTMNEYEAKFPDLFKDGK